MVCVLNNINKKKKQNKKKKKKNKNKNNNKNNKPPEPNLINIIQSRNYKIHSEAQDNLIILFSYYFQCITIHVLAFYFNDFAQMGCLLKIFKVKISYLIRWCSYFINFLFIVKFYPIFTEECIYSANTKSPRTRV